jgi:3-hydroxyacyl-CoA dehydrogenase
MEIRAVAVIGLGTMGAGIAELARRLGMTPVQVIDRAGFVANALLLPYLNHCAAWSTC